MPTAELLVKRLREKGIDLTVKAGDIVCHPGSALTDHDREALRRNKGTILAALYRERYETDVLRAIQPSDSRIQNLEAEAERTGYVLLWSRVLKDLIAFCRASEDAERVPRGIAAYTVDELAMLFPDSEGSPGIDSLNLIHRVKVLGGGHVRGCEDQI